MRFESLLKKYGFYDYRSSIPFVRFLFREKERSNFDYLLKKRSTLPEFILFATSILSLRIWPHGLQNVGDGITFGLWIVILLFLFSLSIINMKTMLLPDVMIKPLGVVVIIYQLSNAMLTNNSNILLSAVAGGLILGGIPYILFQVSSGKWIGGGDVKLGLVLGLLLGWSLSLLCIVLMLIFVILSFLVQYIVDRVSKYSVKYKMGTGIFWTVSTIACVLIGK